MKTKLLSLFALVILASIVQATPPAEEGKVIFSSRCASCHNVNKILTGPALAGVDQRRSMDWIVSFVKSSQTLVRKGDKDAVALFEKFNKIPMPDHPDLTEENIKSIVEFIKSETKTTEEVAPFAKPGKVRPNYRPYSLETDWAYLLTYIALVGVLIGVLLMFVNVMEVKRKAAGE